MRYVMGWPLIWFRTGAERAPSIFCIPRIRSGLGAACSRETRLSNARNASVDRGRIRGRPESSPARSALRLGHQYLTARVGQPTFGVVGDILGIANSAILHHGVAHILRAKELKNVNVIVVSTAALRSREHEHRRAILRCSVSDWRACSSRKASLTPQSRLVTHRGRTPHFQRIQ
jgi:hypothetical protein